MALPRSLTDRPDHLTGAQVHLVYALPRDGVDHHFDTGGDTANSFASVRR